jgi:FMN phosphatase YigB (HAD superfamily)
MIETIIFDYGGVITEAKKSHCFSTWVSARYGLDISEVRHLFQGEHFEQYLRGKISRQQFFTKFQEIGVDADIAFMSRQLVSCNIPVTRMKILLEQLSPEYDLCLISDSTPELTQDVRRKFQHIFRVCIFSDEHGYVKDDGILYDIALTAIGTDPNKCLYIDDRKEKLEYPRSKGVHSIHFENVELLRTELVSGYGIDKHLLANDEYDNPIV